MSLATLREVLDTIDGDPREFVAAFERELDATGAPLALWEAVQRWNGGGL